MQTSNACRVILSFTLTVLLVLLAHVGYCAESGHRKIIDDLKNGKSIRVTYDYYLTGKKMGSLSCDFDKNPDPNPGKKEYLLRSRLSLDFSSIGMNKKVLATERAYLDSNGKIIDYQLDSSADGQETHIEATLYDSRVKESMVTGGARYKKEIEMPGKTFYILDNNMIDHWFLLFMMLNVKAEENYDVEIFVPQLMQSMAISLKYLGRENQKIESREYEGLIYYVNEISEIMSVTKDGLLTRIEDPVQKLVINMSKLQISEKVGGI